MPSRSSAVSSWTSAVSEKSEPRAAGCGVGGGQHRAGGVEPRERLRQTIGVLGEEIGGALVVGLAKRVLEAVQHQHEIALGRLADRDRTRTHPLLPRLADERFDAHGLIEQIGAGLALEAGKAIEVKDIGRAAEVREVGELERRHRDLHRRRLELVGQELGAQIRLVQPLARFAPHHLDQVAQLEHAAGAGFERLAVGPVHGAEPDVLQRLGRGVAGEDRGAEHHLEVVGLPLVDDVEQELRVEALLAIEDGGQVRGPVHGRAFRRDHDQRRQIALVAVPGHADDLGALVGDEQAALPQRVDHGRDQVVDVALALPEIEIDAERVEVPRQGGVGHVMEVLPEQPIAEAAGLQLGGRSPRPIAEGLVALRRGGGRRIEPVEVIEADAGKQRVYPGFVGGTEARRPLDERLQRGGDLGVLVEHGADQEAHL